MALESERPRRGYLLEFRLASVRGLVVGRFQPLHGGHVQLIRRALAECGSVVVAVGSATEPPSLRNPFSFDERRQMLDAAFPGVRVVAVPDLNDDARWAAHCLALTGPVDRAYGNDEHSLGLLEAAGVRAVRPGLVRRGDWEGTRIRRMMRDGDEAWTRRVPHEVVPLLRGWDAPGRMRQLASQAP